MPSHETYMQHVCRFYLGKVACYGVHNSARTSTLPEIVICYGQYLNNPGSMGMNGLFTDVHERESVGVICLACVQLYSLN